MKTTSADSRTRKMEVRDHLGYPLRLLWLEKKKKPLSPGRRGLYIGTDHGDVPLRVFPSAAAFVC